MCTVVKVRRNLHQQYQRLIQLVDVSFLARLSNCTTMLYYLYRKTLELGWGAYYVISYEYGKGKYPPIS